MSVPAIDQLISEHLGTTFPGAVIAIYRGDSVRYLRAVGVQHVQPELGERDPVDTATIFDLASLTKPLATTLLVLSLIEGAGISADRSIGAFLPSLRGDGRNRTLRELMTHTAGFPPIPQLHEGFPDPNRVDPTCAKRSLYDVASHAVPGSAVLYSCTGYLLLGEFVESIFGTDLSTAFRSIVSGPAGLVDAGFRAITNHTVNLHRTAVTEYCPWRNQWVRGVVHDESAYCLGGVAGNAGLFATIDEVFELVSVFRRLGRLRTEDGTRTIRLFSDRTAREAVALQTSHSPARRGLGLELAGPASESGHTLPDSAYGHTGFTGTSFWVIPETDTTIIALTNRVHYGRTPTAPRITAFRAELNRLVRQAAGNL